MTDYNKWSGLGHAFGISENRLVIYSTFGLASLQRSGYPGLDGSKIEIVAYFNDVELIDEDGISEQRNTFFDRELFSIKAEIHEKPCQPGSFEWKAISLTRTGCVTDARINHVSNKQLFLAPDGSSFKRCHDYYAQKVPIRGQHDYLSAFLTQPFIPGQVVTTFHPPLDGEERLENTFVVGSLVSVFSRLYRTKGGSFQWKVLALQWKNEKTVNETGPLVIYNGHRFVKILANGQYERLFIPYEVVKHSNRVLFENSTVNSLVKVKIAFANLRLRVMEAELVNPADLFPDLVPYEDKLSWLPLLEPSNDNLDNYSLNFTGDYTTVEGVALFDLYVENYMDNYPLNQSEIDSLVRTLNYWKVQSVINDLIQNERYELAYRHAMGRLYFNYHEKLCRANELVEESPVLGSVLSVPEDRKFYFRRGLLELVISDVEEQFTVGSPATVDFLYEDENPIEKKKDQKVRCRVRSNVDGLLTLMFEPSQSAKIMDNDWLHGKDGIYIEELEHDSTIRNLLNKIKYVFHSGLPSIDSPISPIIQGLIGNFPLVFGEEERPSDKPSFSEMNLTSYNQLNVEQKMAVDNVITKKTPATLVDGPPGTGKTKVAVVSIAGYAHAVKDGKILVCAPSNVAVLNLAEQFTRFQHEFPKLTAMVLSSKSQRYEHMNMELSPYNILYSMYLSAIGIPTGKNGLPVFTQHITKILMDWGKIQESLKSIDESTLPADIEAHVKSSCFAEELYHILVNALIRSCRVIFCTTAVAIMHYLEHQQFSMVVLDEATQCPEFEAVSVLAKAELKRDSVFLMLGDPSQLGPNTSISIDKPTVEKVSLFHRVQLSCLARLVEKPIKTTALVHLKTNYRNCEEIGLFNNKRFYGNRTIYVNNHKILEGFPFSHGNIPLHIYDVAGGANLEGTSLVNHNEAEAIKECVLQLLWNLTSLNSGDILVICYYLAQVEHLRSILPHGVMVKTVDGCQGREAPIVILSTVRSNRPTIGFADDPRRFNVATTRSKLMTFIFGDLKYLMNESPMWSAFLRFSEKKSYITSWIKERANMIQ